VHLACRRRRESGRPCAFRPRHNQQEQSATSEHRYSCKLLRLCVVQRTLCVAGLERGFREDFTDSSEHRFESIPLSILCSITSILQKTEPTKATCLFLLLFVLFLNCIYEQQPHTANWRPLCLSDGGSREAWSTLNERSGKRVHNGKLKVRKPEPLGLNEAQNEVVELEREDP